MTQPASFRDILRAYSDSVAKGYSDAELTPRERRLTVLALNTLANDSSCLREYGRFDAEARNIIIRRFVNFQWDANVSFFVEAAGGKKALIDYGAAFALAVEIVRNI